MPRYRMNIEYDGRGFVGWQRQDTGLAVQQVLEEAAFKFCGEKTTVYGAGRTDAGVHALDQVAHMDLDLDVRPDKIRDALNAQARPHHLSVLSVEKVDDEFHARFSATGRAYVYKILNRRGPAAVHKGLVWWLPVALDTDAMHEAAQVLVGKHDFTSFRSVRCQGKSPVKTLDSISVVRDGDNIEIHVSARSFLHNQVRILVGTLRQVGEGKWDRNDLKTALEACDRCAAGQTAPPMGLYLSEVRY